MNMIKGHLKKLEGFGDYRIALMAASPNASIDEMTKMTDNTESVYINSGRVIIQANPNVLGAFAAKVACTPYYQDPAYNPYRTITTQDIKKYRRDELETILDAGLVVDWEVVVDSTLGMKVVEPVYAPATNYTSEATPGDAWLHHRLNADHQSKITDGKARPYIKQNNTETARQAIEQKCKSHLEEEVKKERIDGYSYELYPNRADPYSLIVKMKILPVKSIHVIEINRTIQA